MRELGPEDRDSDTTYLLRKNLGRNIVLPTPYDDMFFIWRIKCVADKEGWEKDLE